MSTKNFGFTIEYYSNDIYDHEIKHTTIKGYENASFAYDAMIEFTDNLKGKYIRSYVFEILCYDEI